MTKRLYRSYQAFLLLVTSFVVFMSFYYQYVSGMQPCPLCIMQRVCAFILGMFFLMGMCLSAAHRGKIVAFFQMFFSLAGIYFAGRQLWLQSLPAEKLPACLPGFDLMLQYFPWQDILHALFLGAGDCAEQHWSWLGLSMAAWSLLYFVAMFIASLIGFYLLKRTLVKLTGKN